MKTLVSLKGQTTLWLLAGEATWSIWFNPKKIATKGFSMDFGSTGCAK